MFSCLIFTRSRYTANSSLSKLLFDLFERVINTCHGMYFAELLSQTFEGSEDYFPSCSFILDSIKCTS